MRTPASTLKLKRFRRRFGLTAPRVAIRTHLEWYWYAGALLVVICLVATMVWWLAKRGEVSQFEAEVDRLRQQVQVQDEEIIHLRLNAGTEQSAVQVERTAQQQLVFRLKQLERENAVLKEDMALFERLVSADIAESALTIERVGLEGDAASGRYRYRLLARFQSGKQEREFRGRLQFALTTSLGGKEAQLVLPGPKDVQADYAVEVRHFLRKEGGFSLPPGTRVKRIEARLMQGGTVRASALGNL